MKFTNEQLYLVTGASSGIGEATALMLNKEGATVVGIGRNTERLNALKEKAIYPEFIHVEQKDLTENIGDLPEYVKNLCDKYGAFSGMACCSGVTELAPLRALDETNMKKLFDINYFVPLFLAQGFVKKGMNIGRGSSFVSIASIAYAYPAKGVISYSGSKAALVTSMKAVALEYASKGIRFNVVSPSDVKTPMTDNISEIMAQVEHNYPLGFAEPNDVASMIVYLLSNDAKWITGQNYILDCCSR